MIFHYRSIHKHKNIQTNIPKNDYKQNQTANKQTFSNNKQEMHMHMCRTQVPHMKQTNYVTIDTCQTSPDVLQSRLSTDLNFTSFQLDSLMEEQVGEFCVKCIFKNSPELILAPLKQNSFTLCFSCPSSSIPTQLYTYLLH